jgi:hypothetical protein
MMLGSLRQIVLNVKRRTKKLFRLEPLRPDSRLARANDKAIVHRLSMERMSWWFPLMESNTTTKAEYIRVAQAFRKWQVESSKKSQKVLAIRGRFADNNPRRENDLGLRVSCQPDWAMTPTLAV